MITNSLLYSLCKNKNNKILQGFIVNYGKLFAKAALAQNECIDPSVAMVLATEEIDRKAESTNTIVKLNLLNNDFVDKNTKLAIIEWYFQSLSKHGIFFESKSHSLRSNIIASELISYADLIDRESAAFKNFWNI